MGDPEINVRLIMLQNNLYLQNEKVRPVRSGSSGVSINYQAIVTEHGESEVQNDVASFDMSATGKDITGASTASGGSEARGQDNMASLNSGENTHGSDDTTDDIPQHSDASTTPALGQLGSCDEDVDETDQMGTSGKTESDNCCQLYPIVINFRQLCTINEIVWIDKIKHN